MSVTKKQEMLKKLEDLQLIVEMPKLYLANYFQELRNNVDKEMFPKQILHKDDTEMKNKFSEIWKEMISQIDSFEKECKNKDELQSNLNQINEIRIMLGDQNETTLDKIEDKIQDEELNLFKKLFQNKTIIFENLFGKEDHKRLLIVNDEYINWKTEEKNKDNYNKHKYLDSNLIKQRQIYTKIDDKDQQFISVISINMINLKQLKLYYLSTDIKENTFIGLNNLYKLNFCDNQLSVIKENAFVGLNNLHELSLYNNRLKEIKENAFFGLDNLQKLHLRHNHLTELKEKTFFGLNNLQELNLNCNKLTKIKENAFFGLDNLQTLDLSCNNLTELKEKTFTGLDSLQELNLGYNKLIEIEENAFFGLYNLQKLSLRNNQLTDINENTFIGLNNLQGLDLYGNRLQEIKKNTFIAFKNLKKLEVSPQTIVIKD